MDYTHPHTPVPSPEAFAKARELNLAPVTVVYRPAGEESRATTMFVDLMPRIGETLMIEERIYRVEEVIHRIDAMIPEQIEDFITSSPRVMAIEAEGGDHEVTE